MSAPIEYDLREALFTALQFRPEIDVALLMGSASDWKHLRPTVAVLRELGLRFRVHVTSAHRSPERTAAIARTSRNTRD